MNKVKEKFNQLWDLFAYYCKDIRDSLYVPNKTEIELWIDFSLWLTDITKNQGSIETDNKQEPVVIEDNEGLPDD